MNAQITTREELDALPEDSVIASIPRDERARLDAGVAVWCKFNERWFGAGCTSADEADYIIGGGDLFVLYRPDEPSQRVKPHRDTLALTIARSRGHAGVVTVKDYRCADAILALFAGQPTVAEVREQALRDAVDDMAEPVAQYLHRNSCLSWLRARADREAEGGAR